MRGRGDLLEGTESAGRLQINRWLGENTEGFGEERKRMVKGCGNPEWVYSFGSTIWVALDMDSWIRFFEFNLRFAQCQWSICLSTSRMRMHKLSMM